MQTRRSLAGAAVVRGGRVPRRERCHRARRRGPPPRSPALTVSAECRRHARALRRDRESGRRRPESRLSVIVKGSQNPTPSPSSRATRCCSTKADLLVANGQLIELGWLDTALVNARNANIMEGHPGFVNCSIGVDIIPYSSEEIEGTPFFILNLGVGGTMRLGNHHYWLDPGNTTIIAQEHRRQVRRG